jgi:hypothetical protein
MKEEREPSLEAAGDLGAGALPRAPLRERPHPRQVVAIRELLDEKIAQRRGRLADDEAGMASAFDQDDATAATAQRQGGERAGEAGADNRDVGVDALDRSQPGHWAAP